MTEVNTPSLADQLMSEADLASFVEDCLTTFQWLWCHFRPGRVISNGRETYRTAITGHKGICDYIAVRPPKLLFIELKSEKGKLSPDQLRWINALEDCQKVLFTDPLFLKRQKVSGSVTTGNTLTIPEVYVFRPSDSQPDGGKIYEVLR